MKHKCTSWAIVSTMERPDGTWYDHTITDFPEHIAIKINERLQDYKATEEEALDPNNKYVLKNGKIEIVYGDKTKDNNDK